MGKFKGSIKTPLENIKDQYSQLNEKDKNLLIVKQANSITIIDYETSNQKKLLSAKKLNTDIKELDKKNVQNLIIKCQRLYLISKHKLYKELDYQNLEDFAQNEHNISRRQLQKYVSIFEKLERKILDFFSSQNGKSTSHFDDLSIEKLYLLSKIEEETQINEWFDRLINDHLSVSELKHELKNENLLYSAELKEKQSVLDKMIKMSQKLPKELKDSDKERVKALIERLQAFFREG